MDPKANNLNWFEIPATDIKRAKTFYSTIFSISMHEMEMGEMICAFFPSEPKSGKANGCLAKSPMHKPSAEGAVIYLNANPDMSNVLGKIESAGGKIVMPKTSLGPNGFMAHFIDTEGNKVALHSQN